MNTRLYLKTLQLIYSYKKHNFSLSQIKHIAICKGWIKNDTITDKGKQVSFKTYLVMKARSQLGINRPLAD